MTLGVLGGMGVQATGLFYNMLASLQSVETEQQYTDVLLYSKPSIPDRSAYILKRSAESPFHSLLDGVQTLQNAGVSCIAIPCITAHYFYDELAAASSTPIINILTAVARHAHAQGIKKIGVLATAGTLHAGLLQKAFAEFDICVVTPKDENTVMQVVYEVKRGAHVSHTHLQHMSKELYQAGAQAVLLGCTELSIIAASAPHEYIDALQVLATCALAACTSK